MAKRSDVLDGAMLAPEATEICPGVKLRRMSLGSLDLLCKINSPFADLEKFAKAKDSAAVKELAKAMIKDIKVSEIVSFIYVHGAPIDEVFQTVEGERDKLSARATRFALQIPFPLMSRAVDEILKDLKEIIASQADAIPDDLSVKSKNKQGLAE